METCPPAQYKALGTLGRDFMSRYFALLLVSLISLPAFGRMDPKPGGDAPAPKLTPRQILSGIYQPLSGPLAEMKRNLRQDRNYIIWAHVPAQHPMDLRSAEMFRRWALGTPITQMSISHNMVAFRCRNPDGKFVEGATGMTGASQLQEVKALLKGHGLGVFFGTFTDGHLNPQAEVGEYINKNLQKRGVIFAGFEVSEQQCGDMQNFLVQFVNHPRKPYERFNTIGDPEKFEGGGCVTFARTLLKKAGILGPVLPQMYRDFSIARFMVGGNLKPSPDFEPMPTPWLNGKKRSISLNLFWTTPWEVEPSSMPGRLYLRQIDPEKMVYTLRQMAGVYLANAPAGERERNSRWLAAGPLKTRVVTSANNLIDPGGQYDWSRYTINDAFDSSFREIGASARAWFQSQVKSGYKIRLGEAVGMPVLLLEKP